MPDEVQEGVVSGPDPDGRWHWRPLAHGEGSQRLAPEMVDPCWTRGQMVSLRVRKTISRLEVVGLAEPDNPSDRALVLLNGEPLRLPPDRSIEPGAVVMAEVAYTRNDPVDPESESKFRPVVVVRTNKEFVIVRAVYSKNTEGRGQRLKDPGAAGLRGKSILADDETLVARERLGTPHGFLSAPDMQKLVIRPA